MTTAVRQEASPARQKKLIVNAWYERGFNDACSQRGFHPPTKRLGPTVEAAYRRGSRIGKRELERRAS